MKKILVGAAIGLLGLGAVAVAQTIVIPQLQTIGTSDLFQDVPNGNPSVGNQYVTAAQIAGVPGYQNGGTIVTSAAFTFNHGVTDYFAHAAATLALVTPTTEANPSDGQRECYYLDQTTTSLAWTANTGQTIGANVATAGVAKTPNCITYSKATATWYSSE